MLWGEGTKRAFGSTTGESPVSNGLRASVIHELAMRTVAGDLPMVDAHSRALPAHPE